MNLVDCLRYAALLCLCEGALVLVPFLIWLMTDLPVGDVLPFVLLFGWMTAVRLFLNAPVLAVCLFVAERGAGRPPRPVVSAINLAVFVLVAGVGAVLGGDTNSLDDFPAVYFWFAIACALSPLIPSLRFPSDHTPDT